MNSKQRILVITGPTATGKSALAALLAKNMGGEVVSADSMQVYKHMNIGTSKPTEDEKLGVPHHMLDIIPPWEEYSVSRYVSDAVACIGDILRRGKLPVLAGGTGLYIDSLLSGRYFQVRGSTELRNDLEKEYDSSGGEAMLRKLFDIDPERASLLHVNDRKRIVRALEIFTLSGKTITEHDRETKALPSRYDASMFALTFSNRAELYRRIDLRVDSMLQAGLEREVRSLLDMGLSPGSTAMQAIGYKEMVCAIQGQCNTVDAAERIKMESRRYAKRQLTWLRRDEDVRWIVWGNEPDIERGAREVQNETK